MYFSEVFFRRLDTNKNIVLIENKQIMHSNTETDNEQKYNDVAHK